MAEAPAGTVAALRAKAVITQEQLDAAVASYLADERPGPVEIGSGYAVDIAAAIEAHGPSKAALADPEAAPQLPADDGAHRDHPGAGGEGVTLPTFDPDWIALADRVDAYGEAHRDWAALRSLVLFGKVEDADLEACAAAARGKQDAEGEALALAILAQPLARRRRLVDGWPLNEPRG